MVRDRIDPRGVEEGLQSCGVHDSFLDQDHLPARRDSVRVEQCQVAHSRMAGPLLRFGPTMTGLVYLILPGQRDRDRKYAKHEREK